MKYFRWCFRSLHRPEPRPWRLQGWRHKVQATRHRSSTSPWRRSLSANAACCSNDRAMQAAETCTRETDPPLLLGVWFQELFGFEASVEVAAGQLEASKSMRRETHQGCVDEETTGDNCLERNAVPSTKKTPAFWTCLGPEDRRWLLGKTKESFIFIMVKKWYWENIGRYIWNEENVCDYEGGIDKKISGCWKPKVEMDNEIEWNVKEILRLLIAKKFRRRKTRSNTLRETQKVWLTSTLGWSKLEEWREQTNSKRFRKLKFLLECLKT